MDLAVAVGLMDGALADRVRRTVGTGVMDEGMVGLAAPPKGWKKDDCVAKYRRKRGGQPAATPKPSGANPVMDAIKDLLNE